MEWSISRTKRSEKRATLFAALRRIADQGGFTVDWCGIADVTVYIAISPIPGEPSDGRQVLNYKSPNSFCRLRHRRPMIFGQILAGEKRLVYNLMAGLAEQIKVRLTRDTKGPFGALTYKFWFE